MQSGAAPILHITGDKPVVFICKVAAFNFDGSLIALASSRFSIRNQYLRYGSATGFEVPASRGHHICTQLKNVDRRSEFNNHAMPPSANWSEYRVDKQGINYTSETWEAGQRDWIKWTSDAAKAAARYVFESHSGSVGLCDDRVLENDFDFPVFVRNLPHRTDRREHMKRLLCDIGFSNVSFPTTTLADDIDIATLVLTETVAAQAIHRIIDTHGALALRPYIATAVDRVRTLKRAATDGHPLFALFEDDLVAGECPAETNRRIAAALRELPPDADVLYLEPCTEKCDSLLSSSRRPSLARASQPQCSAGMIFTLRGALRVAAMCTPITWSFDDMMQELVARHQLNAYLAMPGVLFQDCFWGSDAKRSKNVDPQVRAPKHLTVRAGSGYVRLPAGGDCGPC